MEREIQDAEMLLHKTEEVWEATSSEREVAYEIEMFRSGNNHLLTQVNEIPIITYKSKHWMFRSPNLIVDLRIKYKKLVFFEKTKLMCLHLKLFLKKKQTLKFTKLILER